jgi:hypothetical protein
MAIKFNPLTGNFDFTGSGGGAQYIDGEVATYADLPLDGSAALNTAWLVREASGVWPVSRKQAGIYIRTATGGSSRDADYTYAGTMPDVFSDSQFLLYDNTDTSKNLAFDLGSITTGTTRTLTAPDASGRIQVEGQPIGNTTPAAGTFTTLRINSTSTLEAGIGRPNLGVMGFNRQDAPSTYHFAHGFDGTNRAAFCSDVTFFGWASGNATSVSSCDIRLFRDAAGTLGQRNTTNAQTFNIYNTFTSSTNHERGFLKWSSNVFQIGTEAAGTGSNRNLEIRVGASTYTFSTVNSIITNGSYIAGSTGFYYWFNRGRMGASANGVFSFEVNAGGDFGRLCFGGTTSSFPALKRSSTELQVRLADDSAFAGFSCGALTLNGNLDASTRDIVTDTTTGSKIGTGTTQKLGFFNATPVAQQAAVADSTDTTNVATQLNALLARLRTLGLIAT